MSLAVVQHPFVATTTSRSKDKDLLLNDWNIHHLHLDIRAHQNHPSFFRRTDDILFVIFQPNAVYFIDILPHENDVWGSKNLIDVILNNWPNNCLVHELFGVMRPEENFSSADRNYLRKAGIPTGIKMGEKLYIGTEFLSEAGTSSRSAHKAANICRSARKAAEQINYNPKFVSSIFF